MCSHWACGDFFKCIESLWRGYGTVDYVYCLFACVVLDEVDYPQGVIEREVKDDIVVWEEGVI
jgi:hypothetical protein